MEHLLNLCESMLLNRENSSSFKRYPGFIDWMKESLYPAEKCFSEVIKLGNTSFHTVKPQDGTKLKLFEMDSRARGEDSEHLYYFFFGISAYRQYSCCRLTIEQESQLLGGVQAMLANSSREKMQEEITIEMAEQVNHALYQRENGGFMMWSGRCARRATSSRRRSTQSKRPETCFPGLLLSMR